MTATTLYGIELEVALGIGNQANVARWDQGMWDRNVWGQTDTDLGDWVDVTCHVIDGLGLKAGSNETDGVTLHWEAATCTFTLLGETYDPWNGPYAGLLGPWTPVRVRWRQTGAPDWQVAFLGAVQDGGYSWEPAPPSGLSQAHLLAADSTSLLARFKSVQQTYQGSGETASARVTRVLDAARWDADLRDVVAGGVTLLPTDMADEAWTHLLAVADTDLALLWVRRDGRLAYRPQGRVGEGVDIQPRLAVCPQTPDDIQVATMGRAPDAILRNWVDVSHAKDGTLDSAAPNPPVVTVVDEGSVARYYPHRYARTDLLHNTDSWSSVVAQALLMVGAWPTGAPAEVVLASQMGDIRAAVMLLSVEPNMAFDVVDPDQRVWRMACTGWDVEVRYATITGTLTIADETRWVGSKWDDTSGWDHSRFGLGMVA